MVRPHVQRLCATFLCEQGGVATDIDAARTAWDRLVDAKGWSRSYATRMRSAFVTQIARTLPDGGPSVGRALVFSHIYPVS